MAFQKVREFLAQYVQKDIEIFKDDFNLELPEIKKNKTRVKTEHADLKIKIFISKPYDFASKKIECSAKKYELFRKPVSAKNQKIKRYVKQDIKIHKIKLVQRPTIYSPLKQIQALPQERQNMLKFQKNKIKVADNEMILACYGPIVEGAVDRLVLNKKQGTLFVWYSASSRQRKPKNVYLIRRLGMHSKPEWRWQ